jgi:hypothetical protein
MVRPKKKLFVSCNLTDPFRLLPGGFFFINFGKKIPILSELHFLFSGNSNFLPTAFLFSGKSAKIVMAEGASSR